MTEYGYILWSSFLQNLYVLRQDCYLAVRSRYGMLWTYFKCWILFFYIRWESGLINVCKNVVSCHGKMKKSRVLVSLYCQLLYLLFIFTKHLENKFCNSQYSTLVDLLTTSGCIGDKKVDEMFAMKRHLH